MQRGYPLALGQDARMLPRKKILHAEYFYEGEPVCINRGERRTVGMLKSIQGDLAGMEGVLLIDLGVEGTHLISFKDVPNHMSKMIGPFFIASGNQADKILPNAQQFFSGVGTTSESPIEEWARELPLTQLVADVLRRRDGMSKDLRRLSETCDNHLRESCEVIKDGLFKILREKLDVLKEVYAKLEQTAATCNSKFQISTMMVGNITDFHKGLASRIGKSPQYRLK